MIDNTELVTVDRLVEILCIDDCDVVISTLDQANAIVSDMILNKCWCDCGVPYDVELAVCKLYEDLERYNPETFPFDVRSRAKMTLNKGRLYRGVKATNNVCNKCGGCCGVC